MHKDAAGPLQPDAAQPCGRGSFFIGTAVADMPGLLWAQIKLLESLGVHKAAAVSAAIEAIRDVSQGSASERQAFVSPLLGVGAPGRENGRNNLGN